MNVRRVLIALALLVVACQRDIPRGSSRIPIFIISIDTLRSDHLPAYGYQGIKTPSIDALRADSILFESAYSHCPLTLPSHATILTGKLPADTGIRDNVGFRLDSSVLTLPEILKKNGYATGAAVSSFVMRRESGIHRGFDVYDDEVEAEKPNVVIGRIQRDGGETVEVAKKWISGQKDKPLFFMLHLYEPHTPYEPSYDADIVRADEILGNFFRFLDEADLYDDSLIILLSDHGEGLNEHGEEEHGIFLYREALQVPLLMKLPGGSRRGESIADPVQLSDVFPTVLEQAGLEVPSLASGAVPLQHFLEGKAPKRRSVYSETYYPRFHFGWSDLHSLSDGAYHYIHAPRAELFDLASDFVEKRNVVADRRRVYAAMRRAIEPLIEAADAPASIDPEEASKLAALGYLGSRASVGAGEELPDPKDRIGEFARIRTAFTYFHKKNYGQALTEIDSILQSNQRILDLWDLKSRSLAGLGRTEEAIEAAKAGLRLHPNASHLAELVANLSLEIGRFDEAQKHAELIVENEPGHAHEILARVWMKRGEIDKAEKEARLAVDVNRDQVAALIVLGRVAIERGEFEAALARFDEAAKVARQKKRTGVTNLNFFRGDALARLGRSREAEAAFREEIRLFPEGPNAYANLMLLLVTEGRAEEATKLIYELLEAAPTPPSYVAVIQTLKTVGDDRGARFWMRKALQRFPNDSRLRKLAAG